MNRLTECHVNRAMGAYMVCSMACIDDDFDCDNCQKLGEIVDRLAAYEDTGLEPEEIIAMIAPLNLPLTLEELREMDGEPVWVVSQSEWNEPCWMLVDVQYDVCREAHGGMAVFENNGKTWLAYRRKPEDVK